MSKKSKKSKRNKKGGRVTAKGTRPVGFVPKNDADCCNSCGPEVPGKEI